MEKFAIVGLVLFIILIIVFLPLLYIWGLNTLFPLLVIPYTFKTWLAMFIVQGIFYAGSNTSKNKA